MENFSLFLEFEKNKELEKQKLLNLNTYFNTFNYIKSLEIKVNKINNYINDNPDKEHYIWPMSIHILPLLIFGLNYKKLSGVLDNSPNKIEKYMDGYNLFCKSFDEQIKKNEECYIYIGCAGNYIKELNLENTNIKIIYINQL